MKDLLAVQEIIIIMVIIEEVSIHSLQYTRRTVSLTSCKGIEKMQYEINIPDVKQNTQPTVNRFTTKKHIRFNSISSAATMTELTSCKGNNMGHNHIKTVSLIPAPATMRGLTTCQDSNATSA
jgi:hypothetical protein